jgi:hypothetical protein
MFSRLYSGPEGRDSGFAATGLAVVAATVVVALAVTAVAFSLRQKEDDSASAASQGTAERNEAGSRAETMSGVKNAATAMESWAVDNGGAYIGACGGAASTTCTAFDDTAAPGPNNRLVDQGLKLPQGVSVTVIRADEVGYCLQATHADLPDYEVYFASEVGAPQTEPCT